MVVSLMLEDAERRKRENEGTRQRQAGAAGGQHEFSLDSLAARTSHARARWDSTRRHVTRPTTQRLARAQRRGELWVSRWQLAGRLAEGESMMGSGPSAVRNLYHDLPRGRAGSIRIAV